MNQPIDFEIERVTSEILLEPIEKSDIFSKFLIAALLSLPLLLQFIGGHLGFKSELPLWIQCILASIVQFFCGAHFYMSVYHSARARTFSFDLLPVLSSTLIYGYSLVAFLFLLPYVPSFESSALIITFSLFARWQERSWVQRASAPLLTLFLENQKEASDITIGSQIQVNPSEKIPVDGIVIEGESEVDESLITGENGTILKQESAKVFAGSTNLSSTLTIETIASGSETVLSQMARLIRNVQRSKAPYQNASEKIAVLLVPLLLFISVLILVGWSSIGEFNIGIVRFVSTLVIASPYSLILAGSIPSLIASAKGLKKGILFKDYQLFSEAHALDILMIDKTETLTKGKPLIEKINPLETSDKDLIGIAASLEHHTQHPIAQAILSYAHTHNIPIEPVSEVEIFPGRGIEGKKRGISYCMGSAAFAKERGVRIDDRDMEKAIGEGNTVTLIWSSVKILGYIMIQDPIRPNALKTFEKLHQMGIYTMMITGDYRKTAAAIARQCAIKEFYSEIVSDRKAEMILKLRSLGKIVGMAGNSLNDAPALAASNLGIGLNTGSDIGIETTDITIIGSEMLHISDALKIAKKAYQTIRLNFYFLVLYHFLAIPLAIFGYVPPILAAASMAGSSLFVLWNSNSHTQKVSSKTKTTE